MASCSKRRVAPAPAGAPRWTELSFCAPWLPPFPPWPPRESRPVAGRPALAAPGVPPLPWRSSIAAITWPLRIRPVPWMPIDCASRCRSGRSIADRPVPPRRLAAVVPAVPAVSAAPALESPSGQERTAPAGSGEAPARPAASPGHGDAVGGSSGRPEEPVVVSVVSLTRGPSQGAGADRRFGRCHPLSRSGRSAGPIVVPSAIPAAICGLSRTRQVRSHALPTCAALRSQPASQ